MESSLCSICNAVDVKGNACPCGVNTCRVCSRRCILEYTHACVCVGCQRPWYMDEAIERLGKVFWNTTYRHMRRIELRRTDEMFISETLHEAALVREERRMISEMADLMREIHNGRIDLVPEYRRLHDIHLAASQRHSDPHFKRCTESECPGFLTPHPDNANHLVCQTCNSHTCVRCGERLENHTNGTCDEILVASHQAILRECKPCVRCHAPSYRVEGCPTMWCPKCHTFWNWDTERIIEARGANPHNPDHRAFLVNGRREIDDIPCGGLPDGIAVHNALVRDTIAINNLPFFAPIIIDVLECMHLSQRMRYRYPLNWNTFDQFRPVRISYILGDVTLDVYETTLERMERTFEFRREIGLTLELLVLSGADVLQRLCNTDDDITSACVSLHALRDLVDDRLTRIGLAFQRRPPRLGPDWRWTIPRARI